MRIGPQQSLAEIYERTPVASEAIRSKDKYEGGSERERDGRKREKKVEIFWLGRGKKRRQGRVGRARAMLGQVPPYCANLEPVRLGFLRWQASRYPPVALATSNHKYYSWGTLTRSRKSTKLEVQELPVSLPIHVNDLQTLCPTGIIADNAD